MANTSNWKGFERKVAEILGGRRRPLSSRPKGKAITDIIMPKPLRHIKVDAKKRMAACRAAANLFEDCRAKYCTKERHRLVLALKPTLKMKKNKKTGRVFRRPSRMGYFMVDQVFFKELWDCYKFQVVNYRYKRDLPDRIHRGLEAKERNVTIYKEPKRKV